MSYQSIGQLTKDAAFTDRVTAAATEQANTFKDDARPEFVALAEDVLKGSAGPLATFTRMAASGPGIGEKVDQGDGTIDQTQVTDADLLSITQASWQVVAGLYFNADGTPAG